MRNWTEVLPGFWLPNDWAYDSSRWPDYRIDVFAAKAASLPEWNDVIRLGGVGDIDKRAWGAWNGAYSNDKRLKRGWDQLDRIADKLYAKARYVYMVPEWRRAIVEVLTDLDNIEDQLSTILWVAEIVSKKWIPLPTKLLDQADRLREGLDCAGKVLAGVTPYRSNKSDHTECLKELENDKRRKRQQKAGLIAWFQQNWGRLLEAAQATGTWFDVGIVLGPIMGFLEEGFYGVAKKTVDNYLIAVDAYMPGYRDDFHREAARLSDEVDAAFKYVNDAASWEPMTPVGGSVTFDLGPVDDTVYDPFYRPPPAPVVGERYSDPPDWMSQLLYVAP